MIIIIIIKGEKKERKRVVNTPISNSEMK